ncbi:hypothetical protein AAG906_027241 [Vitis piasezkii]
MAKTRGVQTLSPSAHNIRPRASLVQDSMSEAPQALAIPHFEGGVVPSPPQHRYDMRRHPLHLGQAIRAPRNQFVALLQRKPKFQAQEKSQIPAGMTLEGIITQPMVIQPPIEGNLDCRVRPFYSELCFDRETFRYQPKLKDSFHLL